MADGGQPQVEVAVALMTNANSQVLLVLNDRWNAFSLPMTKRRRGRAANEPMARAAIRASVEATGVPVCPVEGDHKNLSARLQSGRQLATKDYVYEVFHVEPHPDFTNRLRIRQPHLWLSPHIVLSGVYDPISESARTVLRGVLKDFEIPIHIQRSSVLVLRRDDPERGRQFLVRWNPTWGYSLPSKRWDPPDSVNPEDRTAAALAAAERVAREELGLEPGTDVTIPPVPSPEYTTHGVSPTKGTPSYGAETDYIHSLFESQVRHPEKFRSDAPLAWVTEEEVHHRWTAGSHGEPGSPSGRSGRISRTTYEILLHLAIIPEVVDPELAEMAETWLAEHGGSQG